MNSDDIAETSDRSGTEDPREHVEQLDAYARADGSMVSEQLSSVRAQLDEYEQAGSQPKKQDTLDELETDLQSLRDAIEEEVEEGKAKAHDIVDKLEAKIEDLRK